MNTGYKLFEMNQESKLFPLFIGKTKETEIGKWLHAEYIPTKGFACRGGWHIGTIPSAPWLMSVDGTYKSQRSKYWRRVWCEVEYSTEINYNPEARENGWKAGKWAAKRACLDHLPVNGYYEYKTNSKQKDPWIICGSMRIIKELSNEEVAEICYENGVQPQRIAE